MRRSSPSELGCGLRKRWRASTSQYTPMNASRSTTDQPASSLGDGEQDGDECGIRSDITLTRSAAE
jgi:hypothetical protein